MTSPTTQSTCSPLVIEDRNVSRAWAKLLTYVFRRPGKEISPLILSVTEFGPNGEVEEDAALRAALDALLRSKQKLAIEEVAFTVFPQRLWRMSRGDRSRFFHIYRQTFPRWQAMNPRANRRGLYFERLVGFGRGPCHGNQLEWILSQYAARPAVRRSMFQATTFDPERDHVADAQLGFPCLQQVSFVPTSLGLVMNAFYATQQIFDKAYGNYLGLSHLGGFMARQMDLNLHRLNVMVGIAKLERIQKGDPELRHLVSVAEASFLACP